MPAARRQRLRDIFLELARVPSPSRREAEVAEVVRRHVEAAGFAVEEDGAGRVLAGDCGNLVVRVPATAPDRPGLLLAAHLDTVEKGELPLEPALLADGVRIAADGTMCGADDKTGVAVLIELLRALAAKDIPHGPLVFLFSVAEEIECRGAGELDPAVYAELDAGIVLDHASPLEIVVGAPTKITIRLEVEGVGGHAGFPEHRVNAAQALARVASRLPQGRLDAHSTANLGILRSGEAVNVIPARGYAEYELRSHRKDLLDYHVKYVLGIVEGAIRECRIAYSAADAAGGLGGDGPAAADDAPGVRSPLRVRAAAVEVEVEVGYERYLLDEDAPPVALLARAARKATGRPAKLVTAQGGSDANIFNARGLPCAVLGCGMHGAHGANEYADLDEMTIALDILTSAVQMRNA